MRNLHLLITAAFLVGVGLGVSVAFYAMAKLDPGQSHSMEHAYRYGCVQTGRTHLNECDVHAREYRDGLAMFLNKMGMNPEL